ncbi:hypothetical protein [Bifidobacterium simiiventris]|uniref:hypothetical protein n=1 Tax=Bifidobacterium simiiventris TaxID=2834434 RepID=UPI001C564B8F|nr:hypothetical protein [Bifidobacterium simiiventris]MBW3079013.1 hypothetical protein [Bifidobacterium simiiventris]
MMDGLLILLFVLVIIVLLIGLPVLVIWLLIAMCKRLSGTQSAVKYFMLPMAFLLCLGTGLGQLLAGVEEMLYESDGMIGALGALAYGAALTGVGIWLLVLTVRDEWNASRRLYALRHDTYVRVQRHIDQETDASVGLHVAAGITSSAGKVLRCPSCGCECILPMGHAILCAACGNELSLTARRYTDNTSAAHMRSRTAPAGTRPQSSPNLPPPSGVAYPAPMPVGAPFAAPAPSTKPNRDAGRAGRQEGDLS